VRQAVGEQVEVAVAHQAADGTLLKPGNIHRRKYIRKNLRLAAEDASCLVSAENLLELRRQRARRLQAQEALDYQMDAINATDWTAPSESGQPPPMVGNP
jgi:hypothetical protein